jgi:transposase, IS30 family
MHETQYQQLQPEERLTIGSLHLQGSSIRSMARILGRSLRSASRRCKTIGKRQLGWSNIFA